MFIYLLLYLFIYNAFAAINVLDKGVSPLENTSVGIQFFINIENSDRKQSCRVTSRPQRCCLNDSGIEDCNTMQVFSDNKENVQPRDLETLIQVYPTMYQYDQVGFCDFILDSQCGRSRIRSVQTVTIPFDTRITEDINKRGIFSGHIKITSASDCKSLDEDCFNDCCPVNCNLKYGGGRPYFEERVKKCVAPATCKGNLSKDLPDIVYVPNSNTCRDLENPLSVKDIYEMNTGLYFTSLPERLYETKKIEVKSNCSTISQNLQLIRDLMLGRLCVCMGHDVTDYSQCLKTAILRVLSYIIFVCAALLAFVFCVHMSVCFHGKWRTGELRNKLNKFGKKLKEERSCKYKGSAVNPEVKNALLRDVIVRDIPMELRESVVDICDRMDKEVRWKKRYRSGDSNQVNFTVGDQISELSSSTEDDIVSDETLKLLDEE